MRRASHEVLRAGAAQDFRPVQHESAIQLAVSLLREPQEWFPITQRSSASTLLRLVYGKAPSQAKIDESVKLFEGFNLGLARAAMPGAYMVEMLPWLKYVPSMFAKWKRDAENFFATYSALFNDLFEMTRKTIVSEISPLLFNFVFLAWSP
jgi:hypothetical protein